MTHPRTWPDATATILDAITGEGIAAYPAVPNPRPAEFVTVQRLGGARDQDGIFDQAQIDVECWSGDPHSSQVPAHTLAYRVREILHGLPTTSPGVSRWDEDTFGFLPDEISETPRVIITGAAWLRPVDGS